MNSLRLLLGMYVFALASCSGRIERCNDGRPHHWEKWEDQFSTAAGAVKQIRHCGKCGVAQVGYHK